MAGRIFLLTVTVAMTVTGCWDKEEQHDVLYYCTNDAARAAKIKECNNDPGKLGMTPNCVNAKQAQARHHANFPGQDACSGLR